MTSVLAAVDLSTLSRRVTERAQLMAESHGVVLNLLHVAEPAADAMLSNEVSRMLFEHSRNSLDRLLEWARQRAAFDVTGEVIKGSPVWEIVRADRHAALTVIGSSSVDRAEIGPVAQGVATFGRNDVLIVRRQPRNEYRKVVVAVDLSSASLTAVDRAQALFPEADISVVFSLPTRFDAMMNEAGMFLEEVEESRLNRIERARVLLGAAISKYGSFPVSVVNGSPIEMIAEAVRRRAADLLVVASRGAGATKLTLLGTIALGAARATPSDVLVARVPGEFRRP
jgi:nucleotide-binding universal stress UspA family protein